MLGPQTGGGKERESEREIGSECEGDECQADRQMYREETQRELYVEVCQRQPNSALTVHCAYRKKKKGKEPLSRGQVVTG